MRAAAVQPTGVEHVLGPGELIVSKTDPKGVLTYVNHVFCRMAAAHEEDLLGRPHSVIRHPDMPRAVFKLLWDTIGARHEIFAYVKNLAFDGSHYWVFAHVTPSGRAGQPITGYHSSRRAPAREAVAAVEPLYRELREIERSNASSRDGLEASVAALEARLRDRGLTYEEFIWSVTP
jgi:PAS domain S-box-containing protein